MRNKDKNNGAFFAATVLLLPPKNRWTIEVFVHKLLTCYETTIFIGWDHLVRVVLKLAENCLWWSLCPICTYVGGLQRKPSLSFFFSLSLLLCKRPKKLAAGTLMKETLRYLAGIAGPSGYGSNSTAEEVTEDCSSFLPSQLTAIVTGLSPTTIFSLSIYTHVVFLVIVACKRSRFGDRLNSIIYSDKVFGFYKIGRFIFFWNIVVQGKGIYYKMDLYISGSFWL